MITFSSFDQHSSPRFKSLEIINFFLSSYLPIAIFMCKFHNQLLLPAFQSFFSKLDKIHSYNTRHAANSHTLFPKQEQIMANLTFDFKVL